MKPLVAEVEGLRVAIFREGNAYIVQGLELDICAQGSMLGEARRRFSAQVHAECALHNGDLAHVPKTPDDVVKRVLGGS